MNHQAKLIVFDWDGTLMDSEARIVGSLRRSISDVGLATREDADLRNIIGLGLREALQKLYPELSEVDYEALTDRYRYHFLGNQGEVSKLFAGARELVEDLHAHDYFLAIATGKARRGLTRTLEDTGLGEYFHYTRCADETHSKPHPQMMLDIIDWFGLEATDAIMIGDTEYDMQMASAAGSPAVAVTYGVHEKARLQNCNPLICVDSLQDLRQWLFNEKVDAA